MTELAQLHAYPLSMHAIVVEMRIVKQKIAQISLQ